MVVSAVVEVGAEETLLADAEGRRAVAAREAVMAEMMAAVAMAVAQRVVAWVAWRAAAAGPMAAAM